jgi:hypothetical protein
LPGSRLEAQRAGMMIADFDMAHSVEISHPLIQKNASANWTEIKKSNLWLDFISAGGK